MRANITSGMVLGLASGLLLGCGAQDEAPQAKEATSVHAGLVVFEQQVGPRTQFEMIDTGSSVVLALSGHVDDQDMASELQPALQAATSFAEVYHVVVGSDDAPVPQDVAALDHRYPNDELVAGDPMNSTIEAPAGDASNTEEVVEGLVEKHHAYSGSDANWNWTADANWFLGINNLSSCDLRESFTNKTWVHTGWKHSKEVRVWAMAASHTYGAKFQAWEWKNSAWSRFWNETLQPRHYRSLVMKSSSKKYRKFSLDGQGSLPRVHMVHGYDIYYPSGNIGKICQY